MRHYLQTPLYKIPRSNVFCLFSCIVLLSSAFFFSLPATHAEDVFVQVKATKLRQEPKMWAKGLADLSYGDKLSTIEQKDGWVKGKAKGASGYVHESAVTSKKIAFGTSKGSVPVEVASTDVVLAGKGFNKELEEGVRRSNPGLDFKTVDSIERMKVSPDEVRSFITSGKLKG